MKAQPWQKLAYYIGPVNFLSYTHLINFERCPILNGKTECVLNIILTIVIILVLGQKFASIIFFLQNVIVYFKVSALLVFSLHYEFKE